MAQSGEELSSNENCNHQYRQQLVDPPNLLPLYNTDYGLPPTYVVWQKSDETDFLLTMNFILFTNQGYPLQNSSLGQLQSDGGVVSIVRSSARRLLLLYFSSSVTLFWILSKVLKWRTFKQVLSRKNKKKSQGLRSGE